MLPKERNDAIGTCKKDTRSSVWSWIFEFILKWLSQSSGPWGSKIMTFLALTAMAIVIYILYMYRRWVNFIDILISFASTYRGWLPITCADHYYLKNGWHLGTILKLTHRYIKIPATELFFKTLDLFSILSNYFAISYVH